MTRRARCARSTSGTGTSSGRHPSRASRTWETRPNRSTDDPTTCSAPAAAPGQGVVVCLVTDSWQLTPSADDAEPDLVEAASVRLRAFDATTGETVLDRPLGSGRPSSPSAPTWSSRRAPGPATVRRSLVRLDPSTGTRTVERRPPAPGRRGRVGVPRPCSCSATRSASAGSGPPTLFTGDGDAAGQLDTDNVWQPRGHRVTPGGAGDHPAARPRHRARHGPRRRPAAVDRHRRRVRARPADAAVRGPAHRRATSRPGNGRGGSTGRRSGR